jgi:hypothetical protein
MEPSSTSISNPYANGGTCSKAVRAYVGAFVNEFHEDAQSDGVTSSVGVYGHVDNAPSDLYSAAPRPDEIWIANNSNRVTVWNLGQGKSGTMNAQLTDDKWPDYQRMHQYLIDTKSKPVHQVWGGVPTDTTRTFDLDLVDATIVPSTGVKNMPSSIGYMLVGDGTENYWLSGIANGAVDSSGLHLGEGVGSYFLSDISAYPEYDPFMYPTAGATYDWEAIDATFVYPGAYTTSANAINNKGEIVGEVL